MSAYLNIKLKRVYENAHKDDGIRLLADRVWPRGLSKSSFQYDEWIMDLCPSHSLRKQWHNGEIDYEIFCENYRAELKQHPMKINALALTSTQSQITLLTSVKHPTHSHLAVLRNVILEATEELHTDTKDSASHVCYAFLNKKKKTD